MIKYIEYNGKQYPLRVSYYALKMVEAKTGKSITDPTRIQYDAYEELLYFSLKKGHEKAGEPFQLKRDQMEDFMDEVFFDFVEMIPLFFAKREPKKDGAPEGTGGEEKK